METYQSLSKELQEKTALIRSTPKLPSTKKILFSLHQRVKVVRTKLTEMEAAIGRNTGPNIGNYKSQL